MTTILLYWSFMAVAFVLSKGLKKRGIAFPWVSSLMMFTIFALCLIMGLRMGADEEITGKLGSIGLISAAVSVFAIAGSMGFVTILRKILGMDRYGDMPRDKKEGESSENAAATEDKTDFDIKSTLIILALVGGGMLIGAFFISGRSTEFLASFGSVTSLLLTCLLCALLFFVGFDMGAREGLVESLKKIGFKVFAFPLAAVLGSAVVGSLGTMLFGFSLREGLAISLGFGWYTYAPAVIAGAGSEFLMASAVSFMHNVIRETAGIILIPLAAKKIGYLEATAIPGVAASDICLPIVGESCRPDTMVYSFACGIFMCLVTSVGVPLVMGV